MTRHWNVLSLLCLWTVKMCLDDVVMAFYRRVFHTWRRRCSADSGGQLNTRSCDSVVNDSGSECLDFDNRQDKETRSVELGGDVVLDAETFQEMIDELKTLKLTIHHLQRMLLQVCIKIFFLLTFTSSLCYFCSSVVSCLLNARHICLSSPMLCCFLWMADVFMITCLLYTVCLCMSYKRKTLMLPEEDL